MFDRNLFEENENIILTNLNFYLPNFAITFDRNCNDIIVSNSCFCYTRYASVLLAEKAGDISSVRLTGCTLTNNEAFDTFLAHVYSRANRSDLQIDACTFRNIPGYAIWQGSGVGLSLTVQNSVFDGQRTNPAYAQSDKAGGIRTGYGRFVVRGCSFRNLSSEALRIGVGLETLSVEGGAVASVASDPISIDEGVQGPIRIRELAGVARVDEVGANQRVRLPSLGRRTHWQLVATSRDPDAPVHAAQWNVSEAIAQQTAGGNGIEQVTTVRAPDGALSFMLPIAQFGATPVIVDANGYG